MFVQIASKKLCVDILEFNLRLYSFILCNTIKVKIARKWLNANISCLTVMKYGVLSRNVAQYPSRLSFEWLMSREVVK